MGRLSPEKRNAGVSRILHKLVRSMSDDNDLPVAEEYEIKAVPVVLLFKNGEKRESIMGTMPKEFYISAIERVLNS
ncbi:unnamed protein product [Arabidopsis thaliana]|uniref:(thale cress) hypothetical protein n=1 Tax=Arabidopsis thaliana TaxID=3702 RepID=A0A7G2ECJ5_ARATH|nr:unnamed protein product [Arabidopsis thaliana]